MDQDTKDGKTNIKQIKTLHLGNLSGVKKSLSRLANMSLQPGSDTTRIRTAGYILNILVAAYKMEYEDDIRKLWEIANNGNKKRD